MNEMIIGDTSNVDDIGENGVPELLPMLPLRDQVAFPKVTLPLAVTLSSKQLIDDVMQGDRLVGLVTIMDTEAAVPNANHLYSVGVVGRVVFAKEAPDNTLMVIVHGLERFQVVEWVSDKPYLNARIRLTPEEIIDDVELEALSRNLKDVASSVLSMLPNVPKDAGEALVNATDPLHLTYLVAANIQLDPHKRQKILSTDDAKEKMRELIAHLELEKDVLSMAQKIQTDVRNNMDKAQREYHLRQHMKAIKKELGEDSATENDSDPYRKKMVSAGLTEEARNEAERELDRLSEMSPQSAEYGIIKNYLDWLIDLPWNKLSEDQLNISGAKKILNDDHCGLVDVKERIVEYLAVHNLLRTRHLQSNSSTSSDNSNALPVILCLAGPPGVGKTSLGQSIARALGREFTRMSLGGVRDEAEIRGHRRTYIGAMPGRIMQAIKRAGTRNPVFMLDEIDKIGMGWRGDPSSALLEVLDPAHNAAFRDHYLDVDFDLSEVIFITTANQLDTVPGPLRDRMEIIPIDGYTEFEKLEIAKQHLIPRQLQVHGLKEDEILFVDEAIKKVIGGYTREAGVRNLERQIGAICRKCVVKIAEHGWPNIVITEQQVTDYLKKEKFENELSEKIEIPGIATGLAVTATGGDILYIEANRMAGKGGMNLTGQLGDVMKESAQIAHSFVRSKHGDLGVDPKTFTETDTHLHVPAGAVPKDGPSAGVAMVMALASLFSGQPVKSDVGMTGEVTLRGRVLPVGGIKMKVLAAHRAGLSKVILPKRNERDLDDLPDEIRDDLQFVMIDRIEEALVAGLTPTKERFNAPFKGVSDKLNQINKVVLPAADSLGQVQNKPYA